jgi:Fe2+ or Zn2+ uptake regulation protein
MDTIQFLRDKLTPRWEDPTQPRAFHMTCSDCGQEFDLLNCPWPRSESNTTGLHTRGMGHTHYTVYYSDGTTKTKKGK